ncbi:hypothetical protein EHN06_06815 [Marinobacter sp. NP-4(2019)]|uniref:phosphoribosyltransferase-like protein n=1 Tax=Marinobacter sp. NP-4(2019) TaxID=2488665 RepID=UPI000FC3CB10|nr:hypothetical protein [Marinobacter sp. NP-4(2019)]AZT83283.1 hypothetical protein EHN06_06815 [Marinobacter sp. NP-4(2019)]
MTRLSETTEGISWVDQFRPEDQCLACSLLDSLALIEHDELVDAIQDSIIDVARNINGVIGIFSEREIRRGKGGVPNALYQQPRRKKNRRAFGQGPQPVKPKLPYDMSVGSEGIIAWLVTDICKQQPGKFVSHPSPAQIRKKKVRHFMLVTDMIGSGRRAYEYLDSAWKVASVKSWKSLGLIDFTIVSYTGTEAGVSFLKSHKTKPEVRIARSCPTIFTEFDKDTAEKIRSLCIHYDPIDHDGAESLGYRGSGALLVFSHGCPNNVPRLLFKNDKRKNWKPMFPNRGTAASRNAFNSVKEESELRRKLARMNEVRLSRGDWTSLYSDEAKSMLFVLAAIRTGPRQSEAVSRKTGLNITLINILLENANQWGWIDANRRLTSIGKGQLNYARRVSKSPVNSKKNSERALFS